MKNANCWPTKNQELLLNATLLAPPQATVAWQQYIEKNDLESLEHASFHLLPLVYSNIHQNHVCKSVYRYWWASNHLFLNAFKPLLEKLAEHDIEPCLLKGGALMLCCYSDPGQRVIGDIDILVDKSQVLKTIDCLMELGWKPCFDMSHLEDYMKIKHGCHFKNQNNQAIDLHWLLSLRHVTQISLAHLPYKTVRHFAAKLDREIIMLCPEDQLFHIFIHGIAECEQPLIRWVPDAVYILRHHPEFDWTYFLKQTETAKSFFIVKPALEYLTKIGYFQLSREVRKALAAHKEPLSVNFYSFLSQLKVTHTVLFIRLTWKEYRLTNSLCGRWKALLLFPKYLAERWHCDNTGDFLRELLKRLSKHLFKK